MKSSTSYDAVEQQNEHQLEELERTHDSVGPPSQLIGVKQQTAASTDAAAATTTRRRGITAASHHPETARRVNQTTEQYRSRHETCT